jgi:HK97 family phage portal protein
VVFAVSDGKLVAIHRPTYHAPTSIRINNDLTQDYATIYRTQPAVRMVVDFLARNVAQLSLHGYNRLSDSERRRIAQDHELAQLLRRPNSYTTGYRMVRDNIADRGIYDRALWLKSMENGRRVLVRIPPSLWRVDPEQENWLRPDRFIVSGNRGDVPINAENVVYFRGYNPEDSRFGLSPIESLRRMLSEEWAAAQMREQIMRNGARVSGYISRPLEAPEWKDPARQRFAAGWRQQYVGATATEGGGTPVLEDGMTFVPASQTAEELQYIAARKLSREEVAAAYFIPPPMIGILDNASFSNITEQHKMLYQDTLGPVLQEFQQELELQLLPEFSDPSLYVEFNMEEKLRGSFEEQAARLQTSVGAPFLTRNEARAMGNRAPIDGGDELVTPLNVLVGGQASPTDSAPPPGSGIAARAASASVRVKARPDVTYVAKATQVLAAFFTRQGAAVRSRLGAKAADWWDGARWDRELGDTLFQLSAFVSEAVARKALDRMGEDPDEYNADQTLAYLKTIAAADAASINAATEAQVQAALDADEDEAVGHVFEKATESRAPMAALTIATALAGFATVEAAKQVRGTREVTKTWNTTSANPRSSHAALNGETVPIDGVFSNGAKWPGDSTALDVEDVAGCQCDVTIEIE